MNRKCISLVFVSVLLTSAMFVKFNPPATASNSFSTAKNENLQSSSNTLLIDTLADGSKEKNLTLTANQNQTAYLSIPKNAFVTSANMSLRGISFFHDDFDDYLIGTQPSRWENSISCGGSGTINVTDQVSLSSPNSLLIETRYSQCHLSSAIDYLQDLITLNVSWRSNLQAAAELGKHLHHCDGTYVILWDDQDRRILHLHLLGDKIVVEHHYVHIYHVWASNDSYNVIYTTPDGGWYWGWANEVELFSAPDPSGTWDNFQFVLLNDTHYKIFWKSSSSHGNLTLRRNNDTGSVKKLSLSLLGWGGTFFDDASIADMPPKNVYLDVANSSYPWEWSHFGEFNESVSPQTADLNASLINDYLATATPDPEGNVLVLLLFHSDSAGIVEISNIRILYQPTESIVEIPIKGGENATIRSNVTITNAVVTKNTLHFDASGPSGSTGWINVTFPMVNTTNIKVFINKENLTPPPFPIITTNGTHYFIYFEFTLSTHTIAIQFGPTEQVPVGGIYIPVNKLALLAPYIGLTILLAVAVMTVVYVRHKKEKP